MSIAWKRPLEAGIVAMCVSACGGAAPAPEVKPPTEGQAQAAPPADPRYQALPTPGATPSWAPPAATRSTLKNGLSVWHMGGATTPLVSIQLMLPTGGASDPKGKEGLTLLTADMLDEGAGKYSALELSDKLGELATDYHSSSGVDYALLSMNALAETLPESLALLADIVRRPRLTKEEFERRKTHHLAAALSSQDQPNESRSKAIKRVLFGDGYAGAPPSGTQASLSAITWQDVKKHSKLMTVPDGAHLAIAGMVDQAEALAAVEASFGSWSGKLKTAPLEPSTDQVPNKAFIVDFPGAAQSSLGIVTRAGGDADPNYFAEEVMNEKIGGSFTGRINMNLREDKGYTYGASGGFRRYQKAGYYAVLSNVKSETTRESVKEVFAELAAVCKERPLSEAERNDAVEGLLLGYPMQFDQVVSMGMRLISLPVHNRPADFWQSWPANIKAITTARANEAAAPYCDPARYSIVVAGDLASVGPELKALGYQVEELNRDGEAPTAAPPAKK